MAEERRKNHHLVARELDHLLSSVPLNYRSQHFPPTESTTSTSSPKFIPYNHGRKRIRRRLPVDPLNQSNWSHQQASPSGAKFLKVKGTTMTQDRILKRRIPTEKQIAASRANGSKSKGPVTETGKSNSSANLVQNARAFSRDLAKWVLRTDESRRDFEHCTLLLTQAFLPRNPIEELLLGRLIAAHWRQLRYWAENKQNPNPLPSNENVTGEMRFDRQFNRCYDRLIKLRTNPEILQPGPTEIDPFGPNDTNTPKDLAPEPPASDPEETTPEPAESAPKPDETTPVARATPVFASLWHRESKIPSNEAPKCHSNHPPHPEIHHMTAGSQAA